MLSRAGVFSNSNRTSGRRAMTLVEVLITLVVYQTVLLGLGFWARKRSRTADGYFIGGRALGPWVAALSYAAGSSSAWSILGVSGIAFSLVT